MVQGTGGSGSRGLITRKFSSRLSDCTWRLRFKEYPSSKENSIPADG